MLTKLLSRSSCAECRVCCGFVEDDKWEIPLVFGELKDYIESNFPHRLVPRGSEYVFDMEFDGDKVVFCPMLGDKGCLLGDSKPYDCRIWPFRVNDLDGKRVITCSPVCETVSVLPLNVLTEFVNSNGFAQELFKTAREHSDMVKPYINGYPILAVEEQ